MSQSPLRTLRLSDHAKEQLCARGFCLNDVRLTIAHGTETPIQKRRTLWMGHGPQRGFVVITSGNGIVITIYYREETS